MPNRTPGLPTKQQCLEWYRDVAGWDPAVDLTWGEAFGIYRGSIIMQGIAARHALRQASSERAQEYAVQMRPFGEVAWELVQQVQQRGQQGDSSANGRSKL